MIRWFEKKWTLRFLHQGQPVDNDLNDLQRFWTRKQAERAADDLTIMHRCLHRRGAEIHYEAVKRS